MRDLFGDRRIDLTPDVKMLTFGTAEEIEAWVRQTLDENAGGPLEIQNHIDLAQPEANHLAMIRALRALGVICERQPIH